MFLLRRLRRRKDLCLAGILDLKLISRSVPCSTLKCCSRCSTKSRHPTSTAGRNVEYSSARAKTNVVNVEPKVERRYQLSNKESKKRRGFATRTLLHESFEIHDTKRENAALATVATRPPVPWSTMKVFEKGKFEDSPSLSNNLNRERHKNPTVRLG